MQEIASCEKISVTAKFVAFFRAFAGIPYSQAIAEKCGASEAVRQILGNDLNNFLWLTPMIESRSVSVDYLVRRYIARHDNVKNIVNLASGFSPHGLICTRDRQINYLEIDLPKIIEEKEIIVRDIVGADKRSNLKFLAANVLSSFCFEEIEKNLGDGPVIIICEGLLPYFNALEKETLAKNIRYLLMKRDGVWITPDISSKERLKIILQMDPKLVKIMEVFSGVTGRDLEANSFDLTDDIRTFFKRFGFSIKEWKQCDIVQELHSLSLLSDIDKKKAIVILEKGRVWAMELE